MAVYVISDIHGCYNEFLRMLEEINFTNDDSLILAGDYIDRGKHSLEMLEWLEDCPANVKPIRGNHEEEFAAYVDVMLQLDQKEELETDLNSNSEAAALYSSVQYFMKHSGIQVSYFDVYGTVGSLIDHSGVTLGQLCRWAEMIRKMPYYQELAVGDRDCVVVHAGYTESLKDINALYTSKKDFFLYAREESCQLGGKQHGMIIAGHTPTVIEGEFSYNHGKVFRYYNQEKDCIFYDIDCGCVLRSRYSQARLACIRLEDEKTFYV